MARVKTTDGLYFQCLRKFSAQLSALKPEDFALVHHSWIVYSIKQPPLTEISVRAVTPGPLYGYLSFLPAGETPH